MPISDIEGLSFGPVVYELSSDRVGRFAASIGEPVSADHAHPAIAGSILFAVAPLLIDHPALANTAVVHGDQSFAWARPLRVGETLQVRGTVPRVRERAGTAFVTFDLTAEANISAESDSEIVLTGTSTFVVVDAAAIPDEPPTERTEPAALERPTGGDDLRSVSRDGLIRYAAAAGDFNAIHWDHDSAVAAGLPGVVVHGLLQAGWLLAAASPHGQPTAAKFRFRSPLFPVEGAVLTVDASDGVVDAALTVDGRATVTARVEVAP